MPLKKLAVASLALWFAQCQEQPAPVPAIPEVQKPVATAPVTPPTPKTDPACLGPVTAGKPEERAINGVLWEQNGSTLTQKSNAKKSIIIGALTDIKEDSEDNKANLKAFVAWFKKNKVDLVVVAGDTGETASQIENAIAILAELNVPVFNIIGNREGRKAYQEAMQNLAKKFPHVFDLNTVRRVDTAVVDIVSMPGYFNPNYIHAEDGCNYQPSDVASVGELAKASNSPVLLVSHGGPKQEGPSAIDRTSEGQNVGDPALTQALNDNKIPFGIFGNIHEAGGNGTDLAGKPVKAGELVSALYLHPGAADGVRWVMNDKSESVGMAGLLTIVGDKAKYEILRIPDPQAKMAKGQKKKAK